MSRQTKLTYEGRVWKFGDNVPTDAIVPTEALLQGFDAVRERVLAELNPDFPRGVRAGDIICAGRNFGCSSGRAMAPKAIRATGVSAVVGESFARTFYRNGYEVGLPILELPGVHDVVSDGERVRVDVARGRLQNLSTGGAIEGAPASPFLLRMLRAGGIIPLVRSGEELLGSIISE